MDYKEVLNSILTFISTAAHWLGQGIVSMVNAILPDAISNDLIDPIGYLALVTLLVVLVGIFEAVRKIIWWVLALGWILIIIRIVLDKLG